MKIAITGGAGFIGRAVVAEAEKRGHDVWICDHDSDCDVTGDLSQLAGSQSVIHLAGILGTHELFDRAEEAIRVNVIGSLRVMQWCVENDAQYTGILMHEAFPSIYTATKVAQKKLADALHHSEGLKVAHVRAFNAFGPGQKYGAGHPQKIVPTFAVKAWRGEPLPIWGSGEQSVDLVHTSDLAKMLVDATMFTGNEVFDGGTGEAISVLAVAGFINSVTGNTAGVEYLPMRRGEVETRVQASGLGWETLGWKPNHSWDLLAGTVQWYRNYKE